MGKSSAKQIVTNYHMSLHYGFACGPVDALVKLELNDKVMWEGRVTEETAISINRPDLFGGPTKEGGPVGIAHFLPGNATQVMPEHLAAKMGRTTATCPAYRGITSIFFHGAPPTNNPFSPAGGYGNGQQGFGWSSNNPVIIQKLTATLERVPKGLDPALAQIGIHGDVNPAHIIYEALTDTDWGLGMDPSFIDPASFHASALTLYNEAFGLSLVWTKQGRIEDFISEILDHIQANYYVHPRTGLYTLKLIRDDYDVGSLRRISPDNADLSNYQGKLWGETANEIIATYTNPDNESEATVTRQNLNAIAAQRAIVSDGRDYYAIRNPDLATRVADRDLRIASAPLATADAQCLRALWDVVPGDVLIMDWPEYELEDVIMRVGPVDYGRVGDPMIKLSLIQDVFSLDRPDPTGAPDTNWVRPGEPPAPMSFTRVFTLPHFFVSSTSLQGSVLSLTYPEVVAGILADQTGFDTPTYELLSHGTLPNGLVGYETIGTKTSVDRVTLLGPIAAEAETILPGETVADVFVGPQVGGFVFIGDATDPDMEIALVDVYDGLDWVLARGVLDTVPRSWPAGTPLWFVSAGNRITDDQNIRAPGEVAEYKLLSRTSLGVLLEADAPVVTGAMTARPYMPLRPANVRVNGNGFGPVAIGASANVAVSWSTRNRLLEDGQVVRWDAAPVSPEYAQETVVSIYDQGGALVYEQGALWTEGSLTLPKATFDRYASITVRVWSRRSDGSVTLGSLQHYDIVVTGFANNPAAPLPPAPPAPTLPPAPAAAPAVGAFAVTGTAVTSGTGASTPTILVTGLADNLDATGLVTRYRKTGSTDYSYMSPVVLRPNVPVRYPIAPLAALTDYVVEVAYETGNAPLGAFRTLLPNPVTTGSLVSDNVINVATRNALALLADVDDALEMGEEAIELLLGTDGVVTRVDGIESNLGPNGATAAGQLAALATADAAQALAINSVEAKVGGSVNLLIDPTFAAAGRVPALSDLPSTWRTVLGLLGHAWNAGAGHFAYTYATSGVGVSTFYAPAKPGDVFSLQAELLADGVGFTGYVYVDVLFTDDRGVDAGLIGVGGSGVAITARAATWVLKTTPAGGFVAPANTTRAYIRIWMETTGGAAGLKAIRNIQLEKGPNATAFSDPGDGSSVIARATQSALATSDLAGKAYSRYVVEADANGVVTGIYLLSERGLAGQRISAIKLRADIFGVTASDGSATKYPFVYDAILGKLVLNEVIAQSANIGALAVQELNIAGFAVTTAKLQANAVTNSINFTSTGAINFNVSTETTLMSVNINVSEASSRVEVLSFLIQSVGSSSQFEYRIYRDGVLLVSTFFAAGFMSNYGLPAVDYPGIGNHTYEVRTFRTSSGGGSNNTLYRYMTVTEVKR